MKPRLLAAWRLVRTLLHGLHGLGIVLLRFPHLDAAGRHARIRWWAVGLLRCLGIALHVRGEPAPGAKLFVANHVSWLDIMAIHAACPQARFVSKADVRHWPLVGRLVDSAGTLYLERERKRDAMRVVHQMAEALSAGETVAIFPEGTTAAWIRLAWNGSSVRPSPPGRRRNRLRSGSRIATTPSARQRSSSGKRRWPKACGGSHAGTAWACMSRCCRHAPPSMSTGGRSRRRCATTSPQRSSRAPAFRSLRGDHDVPGREHSPGLFWPAGRAQRRRVSMAVAHAWRKRPMDHESPTRGQELRSFLFLSVVMAPVLAGIIVAGYGFLVWMFQIFTGPPGH